MFILIHVVLGVFFVDFGHISHHFWTYITPSIIEEELELSICKPISLTKHEVKLNNLQVCHRLKKKESVIVKFKCRELKGRVIYNRKNLRNKSEDLHQQKFSGKLFLHIGDHVQ